VSVTACTTNPGRNDTRNDAFRGKLVPTTVTTPPTGTTDGDTTNTGVRTPVIANAAAATGPSNDPTDNRAVRTPSSTGDPATVTVHDAPITSFTGATGQSDVTTRNSAAFAPSINADVNVASAVPALRTTNGNGDACPDTGT